MLKKHNWVKGIDLSSVTVKKFDAASTVFLTSVHFPLIRSCPEDFKKYSYTGRDIIKQQPKRRKN